MAEKICFTNKKEYDAIKPRLPSFLQQIPIYMTAQTKILFIEVLAANSIQFDSEGKLRFYFNCTHEVDTPIEEAVSVCADGDEFILSFANGKTEKVVLKSQTEVLIRDRLLLKKVTPEEFAKISNIINIKLNEVQTASSSSEKIAPSNERRQ